LMWRHKLTCICLIFFIALCFPQSADSNTTSNLVFEKTNCNVSQVSVSVLKDNKGPRKKIKKKRRTILDHKMKMKNGRHCPSF